ncbi:DMT family transporter, partial [Thalassospira lucentensis]
MTPSKPSLPLEIGLLAVLALLWGSSYLFIKIAVNDIPPITLIAIRVGIASLFLLAVMLWRGERFPRDGKVLGMLLIQSVLNSLGAWTILAWGQQHVDSGLASVLNSTSPIFVFLITAFLAHHKRIDRLRLVGACLGLAGVVLIVGPGVMTGLGQ